MMSNFDMGKYLSRGALDLMVETRTLPTESTTTMEDCNKVLNKHFDNLETEGIL